MSRGISITCSRPMVFGKDTVQLQLEIRGAACLPFHQAQLPLSATHQGTALLHWGCVYNSMCLLETGSTSACRELSGGAVEGTNPPIHKDEWLEEQGTPRNAQILN